MKAAMEYMSTTNQRGSICRLAYGPLGMDKVTLYQIVKKSFDVKKLHDLTSPQAGKLITMLIALLPDQQSTAEERIEDWNSQFFTKRAMQGLVDSRQGNPPTKNQIKHIAGMLKEICDKDKPRIRVAYARGIVEKMLNSKRRIGTYSEARKVIGALHERSRKQGTPGTKTYKLNDRKFKSK